MELYYLKNIILFAHRQANEKEKEKEAMETYIYTKFESSLIQKRKEILLHRRSFGSLYDTDSLIGHSVSAVIFVNHLYVYPS